jgi:hypothetical protein
VHEDNAENYIHNSCTGCVKAGGSCDSWTLSLLKKTAAQREMFIVAQKKRADLLARRGFGKLQIDRVASDLIEQAAAADAEQLGGVGAVAASLLESIDDQIALDALDEILQALLTTQ